jgi:glycosyltransferase involved in cell wall biosynthesis
MAQGTPRGAPMNEPLVSIIIPAYNYGLYLSEAIDSALAQTYKPIEVLIIDDGSTDNTKEVALSYDERIVYYSKPNQGLSHTRNFGVDKSSGEFIVFLDADDILVSTFVEDCMTVLGQNPAASFVYTQLQNFGRNDAISKFSSYSIAELKEHNYINAGALVRATVFTRVRYNTSMRSGWEDWDFYISLAERGCTGVLLDEPLLLYRKHHGMDSMSDAMADKTLQRRLLLGLMRQHVKFFGYRRLARFVAFKLRRDILDSVSMPRKGGSA